MPTQSSNRERRSSNRGAAISKAAANLTVDSAQGDKPSGLQKKIVIPPVLKPKERKRIFISGVNSLVGHALFEMMRNDHTSLKTGKKSNKFSGTMIQRDADIVPSPNEAIKILDG